MFGPDARELPYSSDREQLGRLLVQHSGKGTQLDAVIDSGGGDLMSQIGKVLKAGGKVVVYGMYVTFILP